MSKQNGRPAPRLVPRAVLAPRWYSPEVSFPFDRSVRTVHYYFYFHFYFNSLEFFKMKEPWIEIPLSPAMEVIAYYTRSAPSLVFLKLTSYGRSKQLPSFRRVSFDIKIKFLMHYHFELFCFKVRQLL